MQICNFLRNTVFFSAIILFLFLFVALKSKAQIRKYSNEYLSIGVGARALGMSNANIVSVNDATSGYWNPAGLLEIESNLQVAAMHAEYFAGIANYDFGAIATPIDSISALGFSLIRFGVDDIAYTINLIDAEGNINYNNITSFSVADYAFISSYARKLPYGIKFGANAKVIYRKAGTFATAWGFGLDAGLKYNYKKWRFGLMARDVTTTYNAWNYNFPDDMKEVWQLTGNEIKNNSTEITLPKLILGAARGFTIKNNFHVLAEANADITFDGKRNVLISGKPVSIDPHAGIEVNYKKIVYVRTGVMNIQKVKAEVGNFYKTTFQPNIGVGLKIKQFALDYAFTDIGDRSVGLYSHIFSLKIDFYKQTVN
jgi:hypothetical protein